MSQATVSIYTLGWSFSFIAIIRHQLGVEIYNRNLGRSNKRQNRSAPRPTQPGDSLEERKINADETGGKINSQKPLCAQCVMNSVLVVSRERLAGFTEPAGSPWTTGGLCQGREQGPWHAETQEQRKGPVVALDKESEKASGNRDK